MKTHKQTRTKVCLFGGVFLLLALLTSPAYAQLFWPRYTTPSPCQNGQCAQKPPAKKDTPPKTEELDKDKEEKELAEPVEVLAVRRARFAAATPEIADACDAILDRLEERYGKPKTWEAFPIYFRRYTGNGVAGYTMYTGAVVSEVVVYEPLSTSVGGTLDHELTHAFFFYYLNSNFDLFLNEGVAQNSEYRRREALRQTVYRRYSNGDFWSLDRLYGRNSYDSGLRIYHQGFSVVDYLIGRGGSQWFAAFMTDLVKYNNIDYSLARFYGYRSLSELQSAWITYIRNGQDRSTVSAVH